MLSLLTEHLDAIKVHAESDYPHGCGGFLHGHLAPDGGKTELRTSKMSQIICGHS